MKDKVEVAPYGYRVAVRKAQLSVRGQSITSEKTKGNKALPIPNPRSGTPSFLLLDGTPHVVGLSFYPVFGARPSWSCLLYSYP